MTKGGKHTDKKPLIVVSLCAVVLLVLGSLSNAVGYQTVQSSISRGTWLYVGGSGPGNYTRIQDAIDNASDGDTIIVFNGTYHEDILVDKQLYLRGINLPILTAKDFYVLSIEANNCTIDNFKIPLWDNGVDIHSHYNVIKNCSITSRFRIVNSSYNYLFNNKISSQGIEVISNSNNNNISSNNISYTSTARTRYGIYISNSMNNMIFNNIFFRNWRGIYIASTINTTLLRNHFFGCGIHIGGNNISNYNTHTMKENLLGEEQLHLYYYVNKISINVPSDAGQVFLINCSGCRVSNLNVPGFDNCVNLYFSSNNTITNNSIRGIIYCIYLYNSSSNMISNNILGNMYGIYFDNSHNNTIYNNSLTNDAIYLYVANNNKILSNTLNDSNIWVAGNENTIKDNVINSGSIDVGGNSNFIENNIIRNTDYGIQMAGGYSIVSGNNISYCTKYGIYDWGAWNTIQGNTFKKNNLAIQLYTTQNKITKNQINENQQGISIIGGSRNIIMNNNFILNVLDARFEQTLFNHWLNNYWGVPVLHPKIIAGKITFYQWYTGEVLFVLPWFNLDLRPRLLPVNIN
jgi:parallel beta-helix repeat protein